MLTAFSLFFGFTALATPSADATASSSAEHQLAQALEQFTQANFDRVLPLVESAFAAPDATSDLRMRAYMLQGSTLIILGQPVIAESHFRLLLRGRPNAALPANTSPKIVAVFRKVEAEERAIREELDALEHERLLSTLKLRTTFVAELPGGYPWQLELRFDDPERAIAAVRLQYKMEGTSDYSSLALRHAAATQDAWAGELPAEWTASDDGLQVDYFVSTLSQDDTELISHGSNETPMRISFTPGSAVDPRPLYKRPWFWWTSGSVVAAAAIVSGLVYRQSREVPASPLGEWQVD